MLAVDAAVGAGMVDMVDMVGTVGKEGADETVVSEDVALPVAASLVAFLRFE